MKKIKFLVLGILSILLISPVFADVIELNNNSRSFISFESLNSSNNLTYYLNNSRSFGSARGIYYFDSNLGVNGGLNGVYGFDSTYLTGGSSFDNSVNPFVISGNTLSSIGSPFSYIGIGSISNKLDSSRFSVYFDNRKLLNFGGNFNGGSYFSPTNYYVRALYNSSNSWFNLNNNPITTTVSPANSIQLFNLNQNTFFTEKGIASVNSQYLNSITSSIGNGFSFTTFLSSGNTWDSLNFYSVMPYWDSNWGSSSVYSVPSSKYYKGIYIFKNNSFARNTQYDEIGVISKCNLSLCGNIGNLETYLSSLVVSDYICDFSQGYDLKNNCILVGGGILDHALGTITGLNSVVNSLPVLFSSTSPGVSLSFETSPYRLKYFYAGYFYGSNYDLRNWDYNISYTGGYTISNSPDILGVSDLPDIPDIPSGGGSQGGSTPQTPEEITDELTTQRGIWSVLCKLNIFSNNPNCSSISGSGYTSGISIGEDGEVYVNISIPNDTSRNSPETCYGEFTGSDGTPYVYYWSYGENICKFAVYTDSLRDYFDSSPSSGLLYGSGIYNLESLIQSAFSGEFQNFKFYSCPFNSPLGVFKLSSIGGLSSFLLDRFFDVNLVGPFNCLIGGALYSVSNTNDLGSDLFTYSGPKYFTNFPRKVKKIIDMMLISTLLLFARRFRPNSNSDH